MDPKWYAAVQRLTAGLQLGWGLPPDQLQQLFGDVAALKAPFSGGARVPAAATAAASRLVGPMHGTAAFMHGALAWLALPQLGHLQAACQTCFILPPLPFLSCSALAPLADMLARLEPSAEQLAAIRVRACKAVCQCCLASSSHRPPPHRKPAPVSARLYLRYEPPTALNAAERSLD